MTKSNLAFVFPGQGSQKIGMLAELASQNPTVEATFREASDVLNYDLWVCQNFLIACHRSVEDHFTNSSTLRTN